MNGYLEDYINSDFSSYDKNHHIEITDSLKTTKVPCVEIPSLDLTLLEKIHKAVDTHSLEFRPLTSSNVYTEWYKDPNSHLWKALPLTLNKFDEVRNHDGTIMKRPNNVEVEHEYLLEMCKELLKDVPFTQLKFHVVEPGGWIQPHCDPKKVDAMRWLWTPLHDFPPCLKVFPFGWLQHKLGNMYLFNNARYVHAVVNNTNKPRYTLHIGIDFENTPDSIMNKYNANKDSWRELFVQNAPW